MLRERTPEQSETEAEKAHDVLPRETRRVRRYKIMRDIKHAEDGNENDGHSLGPQNETPCECPEVCEPTVKPRLRERAFSIEDMLLAALITLLISEGADDVTVIILGFLLISEL